MIAGYSLLRLLRVCVLFGAGLLLCWVSTAKAADDEAHSEYRRFDAIAGAPLDSVRFFRVYHWQPIDDRTLILWLGREEPYLIDLREQCHGLKSQLFLRLGDFQRPGRNLLRARWSQVIIDAHRSCRIAQIRPLDFERVAEINARQISKPDPKVKRQKPPEGAAEDDRQWANLVSIKMVQPQYPANSAARSREGVSHVAAQVDNNGAVLSTELLTSCGHAELDREALRVVKLWRFEPYQSDDGQRVWVHVPIHFSLR